ncbi:MULTISPECIES: STAS domain-containing protein [unclassified Mycobacterium]|uniref:STAS domain-containing protein n=1 Tax=unclassified Mycobacterium TaxID=2642494 RepID=UPI0007FD4A33|nr:MULTISPECIES: STAS domain-containing protein [unclassified Mycobacterium]OBB41518.1 anti-anti-sigma factor [Mycobacterium sp. 852002-51961_SCH5331710]OBG93133.1 anti-anti-sigma factor [Mycobacterium sp. E136]
MPTPVEVRTDRRGDGTVVLSVTGELDLSNVEAFSNAIAAALSRHGQEAGRLAVDLAAVEYLDSAAINALFDHAAQIRRIVANPILMSVLTISGLTSVVEVAAAEAD